MAFVSGNHFSGQIFAWGVVCRGSFRGYQERRVTCNGRHPSGWRVAWVITQVSVWRLIQI
jgi:hypothetical protein